MSQDLLIQAIFFLAGQPEGLLSVFISYKGWFLLTTFCFLFPSASYGVPLTPFFFFAKPRFPLLVRDPAAVKREKGTFPAFYFDPMTAPSALFSALNGSSLSI